MLWYVCPSFCAEKRIRRSTANGWTVTVALGMYVCNFLAQIWPPAASVNDFSLFRYYVPTRLFLGGTLLPWECGVLGGVGLAGMAVAWIAWRFRDFHV